MHTNVHTCAHASGTTPVDAAAERRGAARRAKRRRVVGALLLPAPDRAPQSVMWRSAARALLPVYVVVVERASPLAAEFDSRRENAESPALVFLVGRVRHFRISLCVCISARIARRIRVNL